LWEVLFVYIWEKILEQLIQFNRFEKVLL
jgi:hypothetical protein